MLPRYSVDDIYSLTHALFYLSDVGCRDVFELLSPETGNRLRRELVALVAVMARADNVDVLGELLLNWLFLSLPITGMEGQVFQAGLNRVLANMAPDGSVASKRYQHEKSLRGEAAFHELYHTTLVACLLFHMRVKAL